MSSQQPGQSPLLMAKSLLQQNRISDAVTILTKFAAANPNDRDGQELLGMAYFMAKDFANAEAAFKQLTKMDPMYAAGWVNLGAVQNVLQKFQDAARTLQKAIKRDRKSASAYYNLGIAHKAMKMNSMAISAYREAIKLQPKMAESYTNLGNLHIEMQSLTQAIRVLEDGARNCPQSKKIPAILQKAQSIKEGNRRNEAPLGRLVNEVELAKRQVRTSKRDLTAEERNEERESLRQLSKQIRELTKPAVALLDDSLHQQLHLLHMVVAQQDSRGDGMGAFEDFLNTVRQLETYRSETTTAIGTIRDHLAQTDPGL